MYEDLEKELSRINKKLDFVILYIIILGFIEVVFKSDIFKAFVSGLMEG